MGKTYKHIGKGYWNNGIQDENIPEVKKYLYVCDRQNNSPSHIKKRKIKITEKIAEEDMQEELNWKYPDLCLNCKYVSYNPWNKPCAECDDGDGWESK